MNRIACRALCLLFVLGHAANLGADEIKVWTARALATVLAEPNAWTGRRHRPMRGESSKSGRAR